MMGMGLVMSVAALPLAAQSMTLPASDPTGIARSGAQVAYGYSLEAAAINPALLSSLREKSGFYLSIGLEMASAQQSLEADQVAHFTSDRNRTLAAFGYANHISPALTIGLKLDEPFLRHGQQVDEAPSRYLGDSIDLSAHRLEGQLAWALNPNMSVGIGLGVARLNYGASSVMRLNVPNDPTAPTSSTNAVAGLVEQRVGESGNKVVPSYSLGFRWAISPRWTMGFTHQSGLKGDLNLTPEYRKDSLGVFANDGLSTAPIGTASRATTLLNNSLPTRGRGTLELPSQTTFGMRQRLTPIMTWEADLKWTSASTQMPMFALVQTPSGFVTAPSELPHGKGHASLSMSSEIELGKFWVLRGGFTLDRRSVEDNYVEPLLGGTSTSAFSIGGGYKIWGGELNLGYQYRQSEDQDSTRLNGVWSSTGYRSSGTRVRMEGMGHLMAFGFKKTF
jgi:long-subunit fatty acid transport protein